MKAAMPAESVKRIVRLEFNTKRKTGQFVLRDHKRNGKLWKIVDEDGNPAIFTLDRARELDENHPFEKQVIDGFRHHPLYSKYVNIISLDDQAQNVIDTFEDKLIAGDIIKGMAEMVTSYCRILGISTIGLSDTKLRSKLFELADKTPNVIIDLHNDPLLKQQVVLHDGLAAQVFKVNNGVWFFGERPMGNTQDQAIDWLAANKDLVAGIHKSIAKALKQ